MTPVDKPISVRLGPDLLTAMKAVHDRHGTPFSEQIRRGLKLWLRQQGIDVKSERKRAATRRRRM